jgi:hypothetical protein
MVENYSDKTESQHEPDSTSEDRVRGYTLIVNSRKERWTDELISFDEVVKLAFPTDQSPNTIYTVTYNRGPKENPEGSMVQGVSVKVKSGMSFYVTPTGQS